MVGITIIVVVVLLILIGMVVYGYKRLTTTELKYDDIQYRVEIIENDATRTRL